LGNRLVKLGELVCYLALFTDVRRQRVQTSAFVVVPFWTMVKGWRLGCIRRWARTRFIPDDWGLNPPIDTLPQIAHERAMWSSERE
jgi:hypothetical protein